MTVMPPATSVSSVNSSSSDVPFSITGIVTKNKTYVSKNDGIKYAMFVVATNDREFEFFGLDPLQVSSYNFGDKIEVIFKKN